MNKDSLSREISKRIISDLGFAPDSPKEIGLNSNELILKNKVKIEEDEGKVKKYSIYSGFVDLSGDMRTVTVSNLGTKEDPELFVSFWGEFSLVFNWNDEDTGLFLIKQNGTYQKTSLLDSLQLLVFIESLTDIGMIWLKIYNQQEEYNNMISLINFVSTK